MERKDLLSANGAIFGPQGKAISDHASRDVRVLVVGNPANTNALIAASHAPRLDRRQFTAMMRLDHNRAISQIAEKTGVHVNDVKKMVVWGNHSATQYPDIRFCTVKGQSAIELVDQNWYRDTFIPTVQQRGAAIIKARGASSAASAASAAVDHMRSWALGDADWVSMAIPSDGSYDIDEGLVYGFPCRCQNGDYQIVKDLDTDAFSGEKMRATEQELREEKSSIVDLLG